VKLLWHGTGNTDPKIIYEGEDGLDMRHGGEGCLWGKAVYFAVNASYSVSYSYRSQTGGTR